MKFLVMMIAMPCLGSTYYVSNYGNDMANGSMAMPWQTISKVNSYSCSTGDVVLLNAGNLWREQLTVPCASMTIGSYGAGARPILTGANLTSWTNTGGNIWRSSQSSNPLFPNFAGVYGIQESSQAALTGPNEWYWDGSAYMYAYSVADPTSIVEIPTRSTVISIAGFSSVTISGVQVRGSAGSGIVANGQMSNLALIGNTIQLNYDNNVLIDEYTYTVTNGVMSGNFIGWSGASGITNVSTYQSGWQYINNTVLYAAQVNLGSGDYVYPAGIHMYCGTSQSGTTGRTGQGTLIQGNLVAYTGLLSVPDGFGVGVWSDTCAGVSVDGNMVHDSGAAGIFMEKNVLSVVTFNVSYDNGPFGCSTIYVCDGGQISQRAGEGQYASGVTFSYNTLWGGQQGFFCNAYDTSTITGSVYQNNVVGGATAQQFFWGAGCDNDGTNGSGNVYQYNSFGGGSPSFYWNTSPYYGFTGYTTLNMAYGSDMHNLMLDPLLTNTNGFDFRLSRSSPALTAGTTGGVLGALGVVSPSLLSGTGLLTGVAIAQ